MISSAVRSPTATPWFRRRWFEIAASMSKPPMRTAWRATIPPIEMTAISLVPPPMSMTMFPSGSWIGREAPIAAAIGCSIR